MNLQESYKTEPLVDQISGSLSLFQSKLKHGLWQNKTMYSGKDIPAAAPLVTLVCPHDLSPVHSPNSYQSDFSKTHIHIFHLLLEIC